MQDEGTLFNESFYQIKSERQQGNDEEVCCPWSDELQNYRKQAIYKPKLHQNNPKRRYTSQIDGKSFHTLSKDEKSQEKDCILPFKSVTIEYQIRNPLSKYKNLQQNNLKLPLISSKRHSLPNVQSITQEKDSNWNFLGQNKKNSLKRYTPRLHSNGSPNNFQLYKRGLFAARRFVMNAIRDPQQTIQYLK